MASAYSVPHAYGEYVPAIPLQAIGQALQYKQGKYDAAKEKLQSYYNSLSNLDLAKTEDKEYFHSRLQTLRNNINRMGMGDLSVSGAAEQIAAYLGEAVDDSVITAVAGTRQFRKFQNEAQTMKNKDPKRYSDLNYGFTMEGYASWLTDGKAGSDYREHTGGNTSYIAYTDVMSEFNNVLKDLKPNVRMVTKKDGTGYYFLDETHKVVDNQKILDIMEGTIMNNPQLQMQMRINSWGSFERMETEDLAERGKTFYEGRIEAMSESIEKLKHNQTIDPTNADKYEESITGLTNQISEYKERLGSPDWQDYVEKNKTSISSDLYKDSLYDAMFQKYGRNEVTFTRTQDAIAIAKYKKELSKSSEVSDAYMKVMTIWNNGQQDEAMRMAQGLDQLNGWNGGLTQLVQETIEGSRDVVAQSFEEGDIANEAMAQFEMQVEKQDRIEEESALTINKNFSDELRGVDIKNKTDDEINEIIKSTTNQQFKQELSNYVNARKMSQNLQQGYDEVEEKLFEQFGNQIDQAGVALTSGVKYYKEGDNYYYKDVLTTGEELRAYGREIYASTAATGSGALKWANWLFGNDRGHRKWKKNQERWEAITQDARYKYTLAYYGKPVIDPITGEMTKEIANIKDPAKDVPIGLTLRNLIYRPIESIRRGDSVEDAFEMYKINNPAEYNAGMLQNGLGDVVPLVPPNKIIATDPSNIDLHDDIIGAIPNDEKYRLSNKQLNRDAFQKAIADPDERVIFDIEDITEGGVQLRYGEGRKDVIPLAMENISPDSRLARAIQKIQSDRSSTIEEQTIYNFERSRNSNLLRETHKVRVWDYVSKSASGSSPKITFGADGKENGVEWNGNKYDTRNEFYSAVTKDNPDILNGIQDMNNELISVQETVPYINPDMTTPIKFSDGSELIYDNFIVLNTVGSSVEKNDQHKHDYYPEITYRIKKKDGTFEGKPKTKTYTDARYRADEKRHLEGMDGLIANIISAEAYNIAEKYKLQIVP